jgi:hypothetical protein
MPYVAMRKKVARSPSEDCCLLAKAGVFAATDAKNTALEAD